MKHIHIDGTNKEVDFVRVHAENKNVTIYFTDKTCVTLEDVPVMMEVEEKKYTHMVVYYNRFACETQTYKVKAKDEKEAKRLFYEKHPKKSYYDCIETISKI